jgi:hypothetical protein
MTPQYDASRCMLDKRGKTRARTYSLLYAAGTRMRACTHTHTEIYVIIAFPLQQLIANTPQCYVIRTRWFKYDRDYLCVNKSQFVPVIFEPPCTLPVLLNNLVNEFINASLLFFNIITFSVALSCNEREKQNTVV